MRSGDEHVRRFRIPFYMPILICFLIFTLITVPGLSHAQYDDVHVFIDGPDSVQTNTTVEYTIKITGGPAEGNENGTWSFVARLEGEEQPLIAKIYPDMLNSTENTFKANISFPNDSQTIKLIVNGSSYTNLTDKMWSGDIVQEIDVFEPIIINISAVIRNPSEMDVEDVLISFYIDGNFIGQKSENIPANSTKKVYYNWIASKADEGQHDVQVRINDDSRLLEFNQGDNIFNMTIYVGERPEREMAPIMIFNSDGLIFFILFFGSFLGLGAVLMWNKTRRGRGYYSQGSTYFMYFMGFIYVLLSVPVLSVYQILLDNPDVSGSSGGRLRDAIIIFIIGFALIFLTWDRTRKKRR